MAYNELSVIFLDREMFNKEASLIALNLSSLDFSITELETMLRNNLFPILWPNFACSISEWMWFDEEQLFRDVEARMTRPLWFSCITWLPELLIWLALGWAVERKWVEVCKRLTDIRDSPTHTLSPEYGQVGPKTSKHNSGEAIGNAIGGKKAEAYVKAIGWKSDGKSDGKQANGQSFGCGKQAKGSVVGGLANGKAMGGHGKAEGRKENGGLANGGLATNKLVNGGRIKYRR
ncbi:hypothetical protein BD410DRAFT_783831 [Rickenella mellea]|uniref:DUF7079 domain-containing protein n=1 Tax=Rickenella mellea TaxID=50990 RepID=A0A4Y7QHJ4_9AGAM|nr:hypothetical protein BD410DRAFT_783831 [Rickenella mellea]